jgi:hypothetical protein
MLQKWEYKLVHLDGSEEQLVELNRYGDAFWEAVGVAVHPGRGGSGAPVTMVLLKRVRTGNPETLGTVGQVSVLEG